MAKPWRSASPWRSAFRLSLACARGRRGAGRRASRRCGLPTRLAEFGLDGTGRRARSAGWPRQEECRRRRIALVLARGIGRAFLEPRVDARVWPNSSIALPRLVGFGRARSGLNDRSSPAAGRRSRLCNSSRSQSRSRYSKSTRSISSALDAHDLQRRAAHFHRAFEHFPLGESDVEPIE